MVRLQSLLWKGQARLYGQTEWNSNAEKSSRRENFRNTGRAHGEGARTVYINDVGTMVLQDESMAAYPTGTITVKVIMDDANTFVQKVATMKKTDDSRHNGWTYKKYAALMKTVTTCRLRGVDSQM